MSKEKEKSDPILWLLEVFNLLGELLIWDDLEDYGKLDRIHHWQIGELIRQTAKILGVTYVLQDVLSEIKKFRKGINDNLNKGKTKKKKLTVL